MDLFVNNFLKATLVIDLFGLVQKTYIIFRSQKYE